MDKAQVQCTGTAAMRYRSRVYDINICKILGVLSLSNKLVLKKCRQRIIHKPLQDSQCLPDYLLKDVDHYQALKSPEKTVY